MFASKRVMASASFGVGVPQQSIYGQSSKYAPCKHNHDEQEADQIWHCPSRGYQAAMAFDEGWVDVVPSSWSKLRVQGLGWTDTDARVIRRASDLEGSVYRVSERRAGRRSGKQRCRIACEWASLEWLSVLRAQGVKPDVGTTAYIPLLPWCSIPA